VPLLLCEQYVNKNIQRISIWDQGPAVKSKISKEAWKVHQLRALSVTQWVYHMIGQCWIWNYGVLYITKYCFQLLQYFSPKRIAIPHATSIAIPVAILKSIAIIAILQYYQPCRKTFHYSDRNTVCLKDLTFLLISQHKLWNDTQLRIVVVTRFSWYTAANTAIF